MGHHHKVHDTDPHFIIDPVTRAISTTSPKIQLIQGDHNSERFTFEVPRLGADGHDLLTCNKVRVHYINVDRQTKEQSADVYETDDFQICPTDETKVICSWLISGNATKYAGSLSFVVEFACIPADKVEYSWNTAIFNGISISDGINNTETVVAEYSDVLEAWHQQLIAAGNSSLNEINEAKEAALQEIAAAGGLTVVQSTGNSENEVMSQKAVTDFVGEIYGVDKNNLFNFAKLTTDAYYRYNAFQYDSNQYSVFEVEIEKGASYRFGHPVRFVVIKDGDTMVEELQNTRTFTANGTKAYVSVFNTKRAQNWIMCKENLSLFDVANYGQEAPKGELKDCTASVDRLENYVSPSFVQNENLLFGSTYKEGYYDNGAETPNENYNLFAGIPVKKDVNYIIEPRARFLRNVSLDDSSNETLATGEYTSFTPKNDGYLQITMYASDDPEKYAFYVEGAENVFPFMKTKLSDNVLLSNGDILYGKKWAVFGDSFTHGATTGKLTEGKYEGKQKTYPYFIGNRTGIEVLSFFAGGRTLAYPSAGSFTNSVTCPSATFYYQNVPADVDYITIYLGINDSHHENGNGGTDGEDVTGVIPLGTIDDTDTSTYYGAWNVILPWLMENRPFARIGILVSNGCDRPAYRTAQIEVAKKHGIPFIDLNGDDRTPVMIRSQNPDIAPSVKTIVDKKQAVDYDGTVSGQINRHPNDAAHEYESVFIENFLRSL